MNNRDEEKAQPRRKGETPSKRAGDSIQFPNNKGADSPRSPGGGKIGGWGFLIVLLIALAVYFFFSRQTNLFGNNAEPKVMSQNPDLAGAALRPSEEPTPLEPNYTPPVPSAKEGPKWTVMLYMNADDRILQDDLLADFNEAERVGSSNRVNIVAQLDRFAGTSPSDWSGARRYYLTRDNDLTQINSKVVQKLGEVDMSDGQTLVDFVKWAAQQYRAEHYVLILAGHGTGWPGGWKDASADGTIESDIPLVARWDKNLYLMDLKQALNRVRSVHFDLIGLDASLMGQVEVMSALQPYTHYAVASESVEAPFDWAYASFLGDLVSNPDMDGAGLSRRIVESYINEDQWVLDPTVAKKDAVQYSKDDTIAAIDLNTFPELMTSINNLAYTLQSEDLNVIVKARNKAQAYASVFGQKVPPAYIDLGHFATLVSKTANNPQVKQAAGQVLSSLKNVVISEKHGADKDNSNGLSIYFPNSSLYLSLFSGPQSYAPIADQFAQDSLWDDFLTFFYTNRRFDANPRAPIMPNSGDAIRVPGQGTITFWDIKKSSDTTSPKNPVRVSVQVNGANIGNIYYLIGRANASPNSITVLDMDFLEKGYITGTNPLTLTFVWDASLPVLNDGQVQTAALFMPQRSRNGYYSVEGLYNFDGFGEPFNASLLLKNGRFQVLGIAGIKETGAPREIHPQEGDTFTLLEKQMRTDSAGGSATVAYQETDKTFTFGTQPFKQELVTYAGDYVVGFVIEDLDGNLYPIYTQVTVK